MSLPKSLALWLPATEFRHNQDPHTSTSSH